MNINEQSWVGRNYQPCEAQYRPHTRSVSPNRGRYSPYSPPRSPTRSIELCERNKEIAMLMRRNVKAGEELHFQTLNSELGGDCYTFHPMLDHYGRTRQLKVLEDAFCEMQIRGISPNVTTYNIRIAGHAGVGNGQKCKDILREMRANKIFPTVATYNHVMNGYRREGDSLSCEEMLNEMEYYGIAPDKESYHILMKTYADLNNLEACIEVITQMRFVGIFPDVKSYSLLMAVYAEKKDIEGCKSLLEEMDYLGIKCNTFTYHSLSKLLPIDEAHIDELIVQAEREGANDDLFYHTSVDIYLNLGSWEKAKQIAKRIKSYGSFVSSLKSKESRFDCHSTSHGVACLAIEAFAKSACQSLDVIHGKGLHGRHKPFAMKNNILRFIHDRDLPLQVVPDLENPGRCKLVKGYQWKDTNYDSSRVVPSDYTFV